MPSTTRLRIKIIITLALFLGLAMLLSDLVLSLNHQKSLILAQVEKARLAVTLVADGGRDAMAVREKQQSSALAELGQQGIALRLADSQGNQWHDSTQAQGELRGKIERLAQLANVSGQEQSQLVRGRLTMLGRYYSHFLVARPILAGRGQAEGTVVVVADLGQIQQGLLAGQRLFAAYFLLNLIILVFLAYLRLANVIIKPLQGLAKRAEEYHDDDDFFFSSDLRNDDFSSLSSSLNAMSRRINTDRDKLQEMVAQLEDANASLLQAQEEVIRAEKLASVGRLSAGIAHEIGNPVGIVLGYLELLQQDDLAGPERVDCLQRAMAEIQRINTILRQLLDLARPAQQGVQAVAINGLLADLCQGLALQPLLGKLVVEQQLTAQHDQVVADGEKLRQVFLNLIMNAADACQDTVNPCLHLQTKNRAADNGQGEVVEISWQDNGPGIANEHLGAIFDPFFTTKEPGQGTGLGLSVSYMIIEAVGGKISVASEGEGQGTTFTVLLPLAA